MDIQQEEEAIKSLSPRQYTIRILVAAVCALFPLWFASIKYLKDDNERLRNGWGQCTADYQKLLIQGKQEEAERYRKAEDDKRKADSILTIVIMTKSNIKKAIQNERKSK